MALRFLGGSAQTRYAAGTREILECFPGALGSGVLWQPG